MCNKKFTGPKGLITNDNYPIYDQNTVCNAQVETDSEKIIKAYIVDLEIGTE